VLLVALWCLESTNWAYSVNLFAWTLIHGWIEDLLWLVKHGCI
jgi:hypothetical protein